MARRPLDTGPLSDEDVQPPRDYAPRFNVRSITSPGKDWTAVIAVIITATAQLIGFVWWCSKIDERVSMLEKHDNSRENQASDIAVMKSQIGDIKAWVDRQEARNGQPR